LRGRTEHDNARVRKGIRQLEAGLACPEALDFTALIPTNPETFKTADIREAA
jgi:hypothetical protein